MKKWMWEVCAGACLVLATTGALAAGNGWNYEVGTYGWMTGVDADVTVEGQTVSADAGFGDLVDKVDLVGALFFTAQKDRLVMVGQVDYMGLGVDTTYKGVAPDGVTPVNLRADLQTDCTFLTGGVGYRLPDEWFDRGTADVLVGVRYWSFDNELKLQGARVTKQNNDIVDGMVMLRTQLPLTEKLDLNFPVAIGAGDSDFMWEIHPNLQYAFNETWSGRFGYRRLDYDVENDRDNNFDGAFHGFIAGVGAKF